MIPIFDIRDRFNSEKSYVEGRDQVIDKLSDDVNDLNKQGLTYLSAIFDRACLKSYNKIVKRLRNSQEHQERLQEIAEQPRLANGYSFNKRILEGCSEFEQMVALNDYICSKRFTKIHTLSLAYKDNEYIPVQIKPTNDQSKKLMNVYLGTTQGNHKGPKYEKWAENDPRQDPYQEIFIDPLISLEIVRQPHYLGSTLLKDHSFITNHINEDWRFGTKSDEVYNDGIRDTHKRTACVELKGQDKHTILKNQSAGSNLKGLLEEIPYDDESFCIEPAFEDFIDEGNVDDMEVRISPEKIHKSMIKYVEKNKSDDLNKITDQLLAIRIGPSETPVVRKYVAKVLNFE